jgi:hypothetical protein
MSIAAALKTVENQLAYWQQEREIAYRNDDVDRIGRCDKFIAQCELVVAALREADSNRARNRLYGAVSVPPNGEQPLAGDADPLRGVGGSRAPRPG